MSKGVELSEYKKDYYSFTGKLSDINRQLAFAGIALIWIFKKPLGEEIVLNSELVTPAILIICALASDLIQYIYQSITWSVYYSYHKSKGRDEEYKLDSNTWLNVPAWIFFGLKVLFVLMAYSQILEFLMEEIIE